MAFHLVVNWSAIATTLVVTFVAGPTGMDRAIGYLCLAATLAVWITFNILHRRVNRLQNLLFTTSVAAVFFFLSAALLMR